MATNLGVAEGYLELDFSELKRACTGAVQELQKIDREGNLAQSELKKLEAASSGVSSSFKGFKGTFQEAANASKKLSLEIQSAEQKIKVYQQGIQKLNDHISQSKQSQTALKQEMEKTSAQYERSQKKIERMAELHGKESEEYKKASEKAQEHKNKLNQLETQYDMLERGIEESENRIIEFKTQINYTEAEISELSTRLREAQNKAKLFGAAAQEVGAEWKAAGEKISKVGNELTTKITAPLLAAGTASVKMAMDAESSFAKVSTVADETVLSYDKMKTGVMNASNQTGIAVTDFNEALYNSISAGVDSGNAIAFTTDMVKLAKGGFTETTNAVDVVTTALNAYGLEATEAANISDKLIVTQNLGKTTVNELSSSLGRVIPTAKNANVNFDNVAASMAVLTKNGIATAEATTYYNAMLNELSKSGTAADKALRELSGKGFAELMESGVSMTDILAMLQDYAKKSGKSLADMFGSAEASKSALTIMKNDGQEYNKILKQMEKSAGATEKAYQKMNNTDLEKFKRELNKVKNAGIQAGTKLLPIVTKGVEGIGKLADSFSKLSPKQQEAILKTAGFAAAAGPVVKTVGSLTSGIGSATQGIGKLAEKLGKTGNIDKAAKSLGGVSSIIGGINPVAGLAVTAVAALGVGIAVAMKKAHDETVQADLENHFGKIKLSAEEVEDVAKRLTTTDWTMKIDAVIDAQKKLSDFKNNVESTLDEINKTEWKVSIGLELTDEEKSGYQQSIQNYLSETQQYIEQQHYTASLAIDTVFTPGTEIYNNLSSFTDELYTGMYGQLQESGDQLAQVVTEAFSDGVFDENDLANVQEARKKVQEYYDKVADNEYKANLTKIKVTAPQEGIDVDSFKKVIQQTDEQIQTQLDNADKAFSVAIESLDYEYPNGGKDYERLLQQATLQFNSRKGEIVVDALNVEVETLKTNFPEIFDDGEKILRDEMDEFSGNMQDILNAGGYYSQIDWWNNAAKNLQDGFSKLDETTREGARNLIDELKPKQDQLTDIYEECYKASAKVPSSISQGLLDTYEKEMIAGNTDHMWELLGAQMSESPEFLDTIAEAKKNGQYVPEGIAEGIYLATGKVYDEASNTWKMIDLAAYDSEESIKATLTACGLSASDNLINSLMEKSPEVRAQAVDLLAQIQNASEAEKPGLLMQFESLGIEVDDSLKEGIISNLQVVKDGAGDMAYTLKTSSGQEIKNITPEFKEFLRKMGVEGVDKLEATVSGTKLPAPGMKSADWMQVAKAGLSGMQGYLNRHPLSITANVRAAGLAALSAIPRYANGGIVDQPEIALVGEAGPESVIPLSASQRSNAISLWEETGEQLGVYNTASDIISSVSNSNRIAKQMNKKNSLEVPVAVGIDYQKLSAAIYEQFKKNPIVLEPDINVTTNPTFFVGSREIAVEIVPEVDARLGQINKKRTRGG